FLFGSRLSNLSSQLSNPLCSVPFSFSLNFSPLLHTAPYSSYRSSLGDSPAVQFHFIQLPPVSSLAASLRFTASHSTSHCGYLTLTPAVAPIE
ncbi:Hypothetical predicted protein, partial [Pelobates cultripes]